MHKPAILCLYCNAELCCLCAGVTGHGGAAVCPSGGRSHTGDDQGRKDSWKSHFTGWTTWNWLVCISKCQSSFLFHVWLVVGSWQYHSAFLQHVKPESSSQDSSCLVDWRIKNGKKAKMKRQRREGGEGFEHCLQSFRNHICWDAWLDTLSSIH